MTESAITPRTSRTPRWLIEAAQRGDPSAERELLRRYEPLVQRVVWKLRLPPGCEREDLAQEARVGLVAAIRAWQSERGPFPAFADRCVTNQALLALETDWPTQAPGPEPSDLAPPRTPNRPTTRRRRSEAHAARHPSGALRRAHRSRVSAARTRAAEQCAARASHPHRQRIRRPRGLTQRPPLPADGPGVVRHLESGRARRLPRPSQTRRRAATSGLSGTARQSTPHTDPIVPRGRPRQMLSWQCARPVDAGARHPLVADAITDEHAAGRKKALVRIGADPRATRGRRFVCRRG
jgi:DNA-directed RNA polymerase specialized sigma24 family protein